MGIALLRTKGKVMTRKGVLIIAFAAALLAAFACSPKEEVGHGETAEAEAAPPATGEAAGDLVVCAPTVTLYAGPSSTAAVVGILKEGASVKGPVGERVITDGYDWFRVRADGEEAWVAERFVVPPAIYEATRKAHELGRGGDAAAMVAELERISAERGGKAEDISASPDGAKVLCRLLYDAANDHVGTDLYFAAGKGLVENAGESTSLGPVAWSANSRYFVRGGNVAEMSPFRVYDAERNKIVLNGESYEDNFAFAGGYFLFLTTEASGAVTDVNVPAMYYVTLPGGKMRIILEADTADSRGRGETREYRLRPVGKAPLAVPDSELYRKYADGYAPSCAAEERPPSDEVREEGRSWVKRLFDWLLGRR
jgi:hypothetical protein